MSSYSLKSSSESTRCQRTPDRLAILKMLAEYRSLTTRQISKLLQTRGFPKTLRRVQSDLQMLNRAGYIRSYPVLPEIGPRSELGWSLLKPGAAWAGLEHHYGNHFRRKLSVEQLAHTGLKLELERVVATSAGWQLEKPQTYNRVRPLPSRTPQYYRLAQALTWREFYNTGRWPVGDIKGTHTLGLAFKTNDYVAYSRPREVPKVSATGLKESFPAKPGPTGLGPTFGPGNTPGPGNVDKTGGVSQPGNEEPLKSYYSEHAVVFILCPPKGSQSFWQARFQHYQQIAGQILVVGVFETEEKALSYKTLLSKARLRVTTLNRVRTVLEDIWRPQ
ncbi:MAG: hypothetical protein J0I20_22565 [Chloroflexi bacterium]|nr:hypothetical protein [Chloroflexota bacterium]